MGVPTPFGMLLLLTRQEHGTLRIFIEQATLPKEQFNS